MANQAAIKFVQQLIAAFHRFKTTDETKDLYTEKLSRWRMTQTRWDKALDEIIAKHEDDNLPSLNEIYGYLKRAEQSSTDSGSHLGWASFRLNDRDYSIRIQHNGTAWVISDLVGTDSQGRKIPQQANVGQPVVNHIPADATDFLITPEKMILRDEEILTPAELQQMFAEIQSNLTRISG
jgi:hypothetical protein